MSAHDRERGFLKQAPAMCVVPLMLLANAITYGNLIFQADCLKGMRVPSGIVMWLVSILAAQSTQCMSNTRRLWAVGAPALEMLPIFHGLFENICEALKGEDETLIVNTCIATTLVTTLVFGILFLLGARIGLSKLLRATPVVVLKGCLFGVSFYLLQNSMRVAVSGLSPGHLDEAWKHRCVAIICGSSVFIIQMLAGSPIPVAFALLGIALTPFTLEQLGLVDTESLRSDGWLFPAVSPLAVPWYMQVTRTHIPAVFRSSWSTVLAQVPSMIAAWVSHAMVTVTDLKTSELLTLQEMNLDSELKSVAWSNLVSAIGGAGWPVYCPCSPNTQSRRLGGRTRAVGTAVITAVLVMLFNVDIAVAYLPRSLPACMAWWTSCNLIKDTAVDILRWHAHISDVAIVAVMALVTVRTNSMEGLLVGALLAMGAFIVQYSRSPSIVIKDATYFHSKAYRTPAQLDALRQHGKRVSVIYLDGHLMFGSTPQLVDSVRPLLTTAGPDYIVVNCQDLRGLDYSAAVALASLGHQAAAAKCRLILTDLRQPVLASLSRAKTSLQVVQVDGLGAACPPGLCFIEHYQVALKFCEDMLLENMVIDGARVESCNVEEDGVSLLRNTFGSEYLGPVEGFGTLREYFKVVRYNPGDVVWRAGETANFCLGVLSGELHLLQGKSFTSPLVEIAQSGAFIGMAGMLSGLTQCHTVLVPRRKADGKGEGCTGLVLDWDNLVRMMEHSPKLSNAVLRAFLRKALEEYHGFYHLAQARTGES